MSKKRRKKDQMTVQIEASMARLQEQINRQILATSGPKALRESKQRGNALPPEPVPVFSECLIGYRVWKIDALGRLRPQSIDHRPWVPGVNVACCDARSGLYSTYLLWTASQGADPPAGPNHKAPAKGCECGLYSRFDPSEVPEISYDDNAADVFVVGAVAGWGDVQVHADGMRAEKACVTALALNDSMSDAVRELVQRVAAAYGVPAVPFSSLASEGLLHGAPVPAEYRPPKRERSLDFFTQPLIYGGIARTLWEVAA